MDEIYTIIPTVFRRFNNLFWSAPSYPITEILEVTSMTLCYATRSLAASQRTFSSIMASL